MKRIANIVKDYENREVMDILRGIAHELKFSFLFFFVFQITLLFMALINYL